ncbi:MAG: tRNA (adenosine(37)-N6)-threonylcarbamoyltransferase complex ATPase subunit type 1 TsaE [Opitutales bacterium]
MSVVLQKLRQGVRTKSPRETDYWAEKLAHELPDDLALCLQGPIGSGKTRFTSALVTAMGSDAHVTSPTFNLLSVHQTDGRTILHLDAYRIGEKSDTDALALEDLLQSPWLLIVEWPENIPHLLPPNAWWLRFEIPEENERVIKLDLPSESLQT